MKILNQQQNNSINYQPNFKGVNLVHITKSAVQDGNIKTAEEVFGATLKEALGIKKKSKISRLFNAAKLLLGFKTKSPRVFPFPKDGYLYPEILDRFQVLKNKNLVDSNCDLNWVGKALNIPIAESHDKTSYSFYVLTGEHAKAAKDNIFSKLMGIGSSIKPEIEDKFRLGKVGYSLPDSLLFIKDLLLNREVTQRLMNIVKDAPVKEFKIDNMAQVSDIAKQFAQ